MLAWSANAATPTTLFQTSFEPADYDPNFDLSGQQGWVSFGDGGNGLVSGVFSGYGQHAYIGFTPPAADGDMFFLWKPVNVSPVSSSSPVIRFTVLMAILDSDNGHWDDFRWSVYNASGERLFSVDFDNEALDVNYVLDDNVFRPTSVGFEPDTVYELIIRMDFSKNEWSATLSGVPLISGAAMTTTGRTLDFGDVDAVWSIHTPGSPGNNYMVFDDYTITQGTSVEPELEVVERLPNGHFKLRVVGEFGVTYTIDATADFTGWTTLTVGDALADGTLTFTDTAAPSFPTRIYRARAW